MEFSLKETVKGLFKKKEKKRIWELDAARGLCIIGVIIVHLLFDLRELFGLRFDTPLWFDMIQKYGGILFIVLSGICITLGKHHVIRGLIVAFCAGIITLVTLLMFRKEDGLYIFFGILHLLAFCMLTYGAYRRLPWPVILVIGIAAVAAGIWFTTLTVEQRFLFPIGLTYKGFMAGDYFPIFPNVGYFMIGVVLGRTVYKKKKTLFPKANENNVFIRFFSFFGRHSLLIYLVHQPLIYGTCSLVRYFAGVFKR